jgi:hypothetical protein
MHDDFVRMLQGALMIKDSGSLEREDIVSTSRTKDHNISARNKNDTGDIYINLFDFINEQSRVEGENGERKLLSSRLMPDINLDKVVLNKKQMFYEFVRLHSAFQEEDDAFLRKPSSTNLLNTSSKGLAKSIKMQRAPLDKSLDGKIRPAAEILHESEEDFDELPNWMKEIQPYISEKFDKVFAVYKKWQEIHNKEID